MRQGARDALPPHVPIVLRSSPDEFIRDFPLPQLLMQDALVQVSAAQTGGDASVTPAGSADVETAPLFLRFKWSGLPPDLTPFKHLPAMMLGLELPPSLACAEAADAIDAFSRSVSQFFPGARTVAILSRAFQIDCPPRADLIMAAQPAVEKSPGWALFRRLAFTTWRKPCVISSELTAVEVLSGAAVGRLAVGRASGSAEKAPLPVDMDALRRLTILHGLISLHGGYWFAPAGEGGALDASAAGEFSFPSVLLLLPGGISQAPEWWLRILDGWLAALLDSGVSVRILQPSEISPRDVERYGAVFVPVPEALGAEIAGAATRVPSSGGVVVLGGLPRGDGSDILYALSGLEPASPAVRYERELQPLGPPGKFLKVPIALPEFGSDGLSRLWIGIRSTQAVSFLGNPPAPLITVRNLSTGWVSLMNVDMAEYARLCRSGLSGAVELRALIRFWASRGHAGVLSVGGGLSRPEADVWRLFGTVAAGSGSSSSDWYRLMFLQGVSVAPGREALATALADTLQAEGGEGSAPHVRFPAWNGAIVAATLRAGDGIEAVGWFRRRLDRMRIDARRRGGGGSAPCGALFVTADLGELGREPKRGGAFSTSSGRTGVPVLLEIAHPEGAEPSLEGMEPPLLSGYALRSAAYSTSGWRPVAFRVIMLSAGETRVEVPETLMRGPLRVLAREPFFGFRALAEVF